MRSKDKFTLASTDGTAWGAAFRREFDLVVAANVFAAMKYGSTLYNVVLDDRLAEHCLPLDGGCQRRFVGEFELPANNWSAAMDAIEFLKTHPRGNWLLARMDGNYEAYMSSGNGGLSSSAGDNFTTTRPDAPDLCFEHLYGQLMEHEAYYRRQEITREIVQATYAARAVMPGTVVQDVYLASKRWKKVEYLGPAGPEIGEQHEGKAVVRATRPGVKTALIAVDPEAFISLFKVPLVMPEAYVDPGNENRLSTLFERRRAAAQAALEALASEPGSPVALSGARLPKPGYWRKDGENLTTVLYVGGAGRLQALPPFEAEFDEGSDALVSLSGGPAAAAPAMAAR